MTDPAILHRKFVEATEATRAFAHFLTEVQLGGWAGRFNTLSEYLAREDANGALHLQKTFRFNGPGSLSDVLIERQQEFDRLWGAQSRAMSNLRLYIEYGADRKSGVEKPKTESDSNTL